MSEIRGHKEIKDGRDWAEQTEYREIKEGKAL
jgi:hypothetical protein